MSVNDQLDELLASFDIPSETPSPASSRQSAALDDFDFLDNFLAEMEQEKKPKGPGSSPKPAPARSPNTSQRPITKADELLGELEDLVQPKASPVPSKKPPVASPWKAVEAAPAQPKEISLDTSKDIRALKKELQSVNKELAGKMEAKKNEDDLSGFEVAKVKPKIATKAVSLDSPEELALLEAELTGSPMSRRAPPPVEPEAEEGHTTRAKAQPQGRKPLIAGQPKPKPMPVMQKPVVVQQPTPVALPARPPSARQPPPSVTVAAASPRAATSAQASIEDFDRLLDEISPSTIRRVPDPEARRRPDPFSPPSIKRMESDSKMEEMDALVGELDLNIGVGGRKASAVALTSLADLDEVEKALGLDVEPKPKPRAQPPKQAPPPEMDRLGEPAVDDVLAKLDSVVDHANRSREDQKRGYPSLETQLSSIPDTEHKLKEKAKLIAEQVKVKEQTHDYVSGYRQGGGGGSLEENRDNVKKIEKNLDLILEGIDPQIQKQREEKERQEKEAKEKKDAELNDLLLGLDEDLKAKQEMEKKKKEQEELERKRRKEEEERRKAERKNRDLEAIEEMVENLSPIGFLDPTTAPPTASAPIVTQNNRQHTSQTQEEQEYNRIQIKHKELARMTGQNLWTAKGDARIDISAITEFLKATVVEARAVADQRGITDPKKKEDIIENCKIALQTVPGFVSAMKKFHAATKANEDAAKSGIPVDKQVTDNILRECQVERMKMLKSYEILLESYIYSPDSSVTIKRATATPLSVAGPGEAPLKLFKDTAVVDEAGDAKNSILYSFRDFYIGANEVPPKPNTIEALNYVPWKPQFSMKEYCAQGVAQFKEIVNVINLPMKTFDFKLFATVITKEVELMVPIAKMIRTQPERYGAFAKFPLGTKVFVNACINFIDAVYTYKTKGVTAEALALAKGDADYLQAVAKKNELNNTLKMLLTVIQNILVAERNAQQQF